MVGGPDCKEHSFVAEATMRTIFAKRLEVIRFGRNEFLRDSSGKLYTKGIVPVGTLDKYRMHTGYIRVVFSTKGAR